MRSWPRRPERDTGARENLPNPLGKRRREGVAALAHRLQGGICNRLECSFGGRPP